MTDRMNPQQLAEAVGRELYARDGAVQALGIELEEIRPGYARMSLAVRPDMTNSHGIGHGGIIFTLADATFAYACNSHNHTAVASGCSIEYLAPAQVGDVLVAVGEERCLNGRTGIYDVEVSTRAGRRIALFRGKSHRIQGEVVTTRK
jgi:acyl-CoA thioesterase